MKDKETHESGDSILLLVLLTSVSYYPCTAEAQQTFPNRVIEWKENALWALNPGTVLFLCFGCFRAHTHLDSACCVCKGPGGMCFVH